MHRRTVSIVGALIIAVIAIISFNAWHRAQAAKQFVHSNIPTIFVHGWGSSAHAEEKMANAAKRAGVTNTIVRANVSRQGKVTFVKGGLKML